MAAGRLRDAIEIPGCDLPAETLAAAARALATARAELGLPSSARVRWYAPAAAMRWRRSALGRPVQPFEVRRSSRGFLCPETGRVVGTPEGGPPPFRRLFESWFERQERPEASPSDRVA